MLVFHMLPRKLQTSYVDTGIPQPVQEKHVQIWLENDLPKKASNLVGR